MTDRLDEQELARLCAEKDRLAEDELYIRYAGRLLTLCRRYSGSREEAEDLLHDSLIKALDNMSSFKYAGKGSLYAWISRITVNKALNNIRNRHVRLIPWNLFLAETVPEPDDDITLIPQEVLLDIISSLPDSQRAVFNLFCIEGYSHKEIAGMLGISEKGSSGLLAKARLQLKKKCNEYLRKSE